MSSPNGWLSRAQGLCVRPVPEMSFCLVYDPRVREIYTLNSAAWLVFELCHERSRSDAEADYVSTFRAKAQRRRAQLEFEESLLRLCRMRLIEERVGM